MVPTTRASAQKYSAVIANDESDYGSDLDEDSIVNLLVQAESQPLASLAIESIEEHNPLPQAARVPKSRSNIIESNSPTLRRTKTLVDEDGVTFEVPDNDGPLREPSVEVEYDAKNRVTFSPQGDHRQRSLFAPFEPQAPDDTRSPLQRFRQPPKKPMSVTDIVSPSWCELQYFYSLSKYGRVKQTPAMKQGSSVHKELEEEVHVAVPIETVTREDMFALRIWNIIQGLRTLRATGMTREFEVWGLIEGQVVNGVIDELSYKCPDKTLEAALNEQKKRGRPRKSKEAEESDPNQTTLQSFFSSQGGDTLDQTLVQSAPALPLADRKIYITDIKTRASRSMPTEEVSLRPTFIQLMLYRTLLTQLTLNAFPSDHIFDRYRVSPSVTFSDTFIAEIGRLECNFPSSHLDPSADYAPPMSSPQDSVDELLSHNNLSLLWELMISEFGLTIPIATLPDQTRHASISPLLQAEFRNSTTGSIMGKKMFLHDERKLDKYVKDEMAWWKGERPTRGVEIEEAFKCRICRFADGCEWREKKVEESVMKARLRGGKRAKSEV
ncbi:Exonuclease V [Sphaceloma murrayae]|uniref:Exonuclease V n=1 Tax=Sphaceloma murrayae TaxID=2082308 RepID=A0A2K1QLQ5_9PEZI|nr:Exonuclease V [Sphaceloma murrayae]